MKVIRRLAITGRVQGVGFRLYMERKARGLGVTGWVRNRADGSVEALLQGERGSVEALAAWARVGPPAARVASVEPSAAEPGERAGTGFDLLPTI